jgi:RNA polymerase sigma factor (sigma-70 family)
MDKTEKREPIIDGPADEIELRLSIKKAIDELKPREKAIMLMRFFDEMTFAAIGQTLGISGSAARAAYCAAAMKLRVKLEKKGLRK